VAVGGRHRFRVVRNAFAIARSTLANLEPKPRVHPLATIYINPVPTWISKSPSRSLSRSSRISSQGVAASEMEDLRAKIAEKGERPISKEAKLVIGTRSRIRMLVLRAWWGVDPVQRGATSMGRKLLLLMSILPHPRTRSRTSGNLTVCEQWCFQFCL